MTDIEYRSVTAFDVSYPERIIDLIAAPYNQPAEVFLQRQQRWVTEAFDPAAFNGVGGDVLVNRAHDTERPVGRAIRFHPGDPRGLRTEIRIAKTSEGDDILELAHERLLAASVGFMVLPGGEQWTMDRRSRTVTRAKVEHIALTGEPAYVGAGVLDVRRASTEPQKRLLTPNLDRLRLEMLVERFDLA
jgi:HK97 family phage prohead protease